MVLEVSLLVSPLFVFSPCSVVLHARDKLRPLSLRLKMPSTLSHTRSLQNENMMTTHYPMMVMPVRLLLGLERLLPHQEMLKRGLLLPYNQLSMKGRVMFISHQCTYSSSRNRRCIRHTPLHITRSLRLTPFHSFCHICFEPGTGNSNADATGEQLVALQRMLERLMLGEISSTSLTWVQQIMYGFSDRVTAATWKAALPHMFVW